MYFFQVINKVNITQDPYNNNNTSDKDFDKQ